MINLDKKTGHELIQKERQRQIEIEGYSADHDKLYKNDELFNAAACYSSAERCRAINQGKYYFPAGWPWARDAFKPTPDNVIRELEKAGALFMAHQEATGFYCTKYIESCARRIDKILLCNEKN